MNYFVPYQEILDGWQTNVWDKFPWILNEFLKNSMQPFIILLFVLSFVPFHPLPELTPLLSTSAHLVKN